MTNKTIWPTLLCLIMVAVLALISRASFANEIYIAPGGSDSSPGTKENPFATLERARDYIRELKSKQAFPESGITVYLREGVYPVKKTFELKKEDSGVINGPIVYRPCPGERVVLSGGQKIPPSAFKAVTDRTILDRFVSEEAKCKVVQAELKQLEITDYGRLQQYGFPRTDVPAPLELVFNGEFMTLARWPNESTISLGKVVEAGSAKRYDKQSEKKPKFTFDYDRPLFWQHAGDIWLYGIFNVPWAPDFNKIAAIDFEKKEIELFNDHHYGLKANQFTWYYFANLLEEIDEPGEWYMDRKKGILYFWPPDAMENADIQVTMLTDKFMISLEETTYVTLSGLTLELSRESGVKVTGGHDNLIAGCIIRNMGGQAVVIDGKGYLDANKPQQISGSGGRNNGITACDIYNIGTGGIHLGGGSRKTLEPANNFALNNHIYNSGRRIKAYTAAINLSGVGNRIANNLIHNLPQFAITFSGNENVIELNEIHHVCLDFSDSGAIYTAADPSNRGMIIRHNFIHHIGLDREKVNGIYIDFTNCGQIITGNVFYKLVAKDNFGAVMINGGNDHLIKNNIFIDCLTALHASNFLNGWGLPEYDSYFNRWKSGLNQVNYSKPPYSQRYPELVNFFEENHLKPSRNRFENNLTYQCQQVYRERYEPNIQKSGNYDTNEDPGFVNIDKMDFSLKKDSPVFKQIPGFEEIPFGKIGLYKDDYRD